MSTLIPASRFGDVLRRAREAQARPLDDVARAAYGQFTREELACVESGVLAVDDGELEALACLYDIEVEQLVPRRAELIIDLRSGTVIAGAASAAVPTTLHDPGEVLSRYLALVYALRDIRPGTPIALRDLDVDTLAQALGRDPAEIERELEAQMNHLGVDLSRRASGLHRRAIIPAAGILVAATAVGALIFVQARDDDPTPEPAPVVAADGESRETTPVPAAEPGRQGVDDLFTPIVVAPGETSVEVPPLVYERDDPSLPAGEPVPVEADALASVPVPPGETSVDLPPVVYERVDPTAPAGSPSVPGG